MKPEIIDLARKFHHAIKGEYGRKIQDDDLVVCIGENYPPFRVDERNRSDVDNNAGYLVIILTSDELWEWLTSRPVMAEITYNKSSAYMDGLSRGYHVRLYKNRIDIKPKGLHLALYTAAVWVAQVLQRTQERMLEVKP